MVTYIAKFWRWISRPFRRKPKALPHSSVRATLESLSRMYKQVYVNRDLTARPPINFTTITKDSTWRNQPGLLLNPTPQPQSPPSASTELLDTTLSLMALTFHRNRAWVGPN
jgi:hypothetical protein